MIASSSPILLLVLKVHFLLIISPFIYDFAIGMGSSDSGGSDAILSRKGPVTRVMSKRLQEDWARATKEGPRVLMNLRVDF